MKPAREPASSRPKPCASLKKPHESCPFAAPCGPRRKKNDDRGQTSAFPSETSRFKPVILAHRGSALPSGSSTIELPSAFAESCAYPPDRELPGSPRQCSLPLACRHPPEGHQIGARKRCAPGNTIILSQPNRRRVSTGRLNREGSQLCVQRKKYAYCSRTSAPSFWYYCTRFFSSPAGVGYNKMLPEEFRLSLVVSILSPLPNASYFPYLTLVCPMPAQCLLAV